MRCSAIIVAAGSGTRLGGPTPKAFIDLAGRPLLQWSLSAIALVDDFFEIVIAVPGGMEARARSIVRAADVRLPVKITPGGAERQDSVRIALGLTSAETEVAVVHDAARPFATSAMFGAVIAATSQYDGAIVAIPLTDTLKRLAGGAIAETIQRTNLYRAQTPQAFRRGILLQAHAAACDSGFVGTDDSDLVERIGGRVTTVEGSATNLKITTIADLKIARALAIDDGIEGSLPRNSRAECEATDRKRRCPR
jgi:2-C-methyl-D-erythritol 4-phosphate cytidylyltransferase